MKRYTKEEFYKRVEQEITSQGLDYVELIEIIEEPGKPYTKSTLVLRDKEYNEIGKIKYMSFRREGWIAPTRNAMVTRKNTTLEKINHKIEQLKSKGANVEFLGFKGGWCGFAQKSILIIKDIDTGEIEERVYATFMRNNWAPESKKAADRLERLELAHVAAKNYWGANNSSGNHREDREKELLERIENIMKSNYPDLEVVGYVKNKNNITVTTKDKITIRDPKSGKEITKQIVGFLKNGIDFDPIIGRPPVTFEEIKDKVLKKANLLGYTFRGFPEGEVWRSENRTTLVFEKGNQLITIKAVDFLSKNYIGNGLRKSENCIWKILQTSFPTFKKNLVLKPSDTKTNKKIFKVDFYDDIETHVALEFNGAQHYRFVSHFQKTYNKFLEQVERDKEVKELLEKQGYRLLTIPYCDLDRAEEIIRTFIEEGRDITTPMKIELPDGEDIST